MLRLAVAGEPLLEASDMEARRPGASYTVDTLREVGRTHPGSELFLIVGIDAWREVDTWHRPEDLLGLASVIVTSRPGAEFSRTDVIPPVAARSGCCYDSSISSYVHRSGHRLTAHQIAGVDVSSTDVDPAATQGSLKVGWIYSTLTGRIIANSSGNAADGTVLSAL